METVAVTGGSGLAGRAVVRRLLDDGRVKEVRVLDRNGQGSKGSLHPKIRQFSLDLTDEVAVGRALTGCTSVVHLAGPPIPVTYQNKEDRKKMWKDSLDATEVVVDQMLALSIDRLVHVGDAFSALPVEDNYGLGEDIFFDFPKNFLLGEYGEARTRAEMYARTAVKNHESFHGIFLRPVHIHGEGQPEETLKELIELAKDGKLPYIEGKRRGMTQFIYADNLAAIVETAIFGLASNPEKYSGELVYCLDETNLYSYRDFLEPRANTPNFASDRPESFTSAWLFHYYQYFRNMLGLQVPEGTLAYPMFRLIFEKTIGFSNKKVRLLMNFVPQVPQEKALLLSENLSLDSSTKGRLSSKSG